MKPIIVATDFSPAALNAVNYAADMALVLDAALVVVHVYQLPVALTETPTLIVTAGEMEEISERKLAELKMNLRHITSGKLQVDTEARLGDVPEELEDACAKHDPLLVVMGTSGHTAFERSVYGSTTLSVVRYSSYPVLAIPKGTEYGKGISRVGLAWDYTRHSDRLPVAAIHSIVTAFSASLHVLHVEADGIENTGHKPDPSVENSLAGLKPLYHSIPHQDTGEGINSYAEKNNLDLILTIPRQHSFFSSLFGKHSTNELIRESHLPVLCIHAE